MSNWKIVETVRDDAKNAASLLFTLGAFGLDHTQGYVIEHRSTGERKTVSANSEDELERRIAEGEFDD